MPKISVIVPVYNVEKYLKPCVDSLLGQTYADFEIILVDDCSKDSSGSICDFYEQKDKRIKVLHKKKNEGLGCARKSGVELATGEWLCYVDSDDWLELDTFQSIMSLAVTDIDIIVYGITMQYEDKDGKIKWSDTIKPKRHNSASKEEIGNLLLELDLDHVFPFMWNKLYNAEFVKNSNVEFNSIQSMEDFFYNIEIFKKARHVLTMEKAFYNYRKPSKETLASSYNENFFLLSKNRYLAEKKFVKKMSAISEKNQQAMDKIYLKHVIACLIRLESSNAKLNRNEKKECVKQYLDDPVTMKVSSRYRSESSKMKVIIYIFKHKHYQLALLLGKIGFIFQNKFKMIYHTVLKK